MNTSLRNDAKFSPQPEKAGNLQTQKLYRISNELVDNESKLRGLNEKISKVPDYKPMPVVATSSKNRDFLYFEPEQTRFYPCTNKNIGISERLDFLFHNPQEMYEMPEMQRGGMHTRTNEKDMYKSKCNIK